MKRQFLCDMHSLTSVGFLMYLFMNDFLPCCLFAVENDPLRRIRMSLGKNVLHLLLEVLCSFLPESGLSVILMYNTVIKKQPFWSA